MGRDQTDLHWEDPPDQIRKGWFADVIDGLKANPGKWARVRQYNKPATAGSATGALRKRYGKEGFEFASRTVDGDGFVYARYVRRGTK